jgi:hypothetical protein
MTVVSPGRFAMPLFSHLAHPCPGGRGKRLEVEFHASLEDSGLVGCG